MTSTVACPECHRPAAVLDRFRLDGAGGPVAFLRIRCDGSLSLLMSADEARPAAAPVGPPAAA